MSIVNSHQLCQGWANYDPRALAEILTLLLSLYSDSILLILSGISGHLRTFERKLGHLRGREDFFALHLIRVEIRTSART